MLLLLFMVITASTGLKTPNIVLILTDDQDLLLNSVKPMENTIRLIANEGTTFNNAFVNTPICCPSRSSILTGKYPHRLDVYNNSISGNCSSRSWQRDHERNSIANLLKTSRGYRTFYAGKYLNGYGEEAAGGVGHVPPGYDWWIGLRGNSRYYNYTLSINGTARRYTDEYLTDVLSDISIEFLDNADAGRPFFMTVAPPACHAPFTPAPRHRGRFAGVKAERTPSFNRTSDGKHWLLSLPPKYLPEDVSRLDYIQQRRLETLLSVDELVERLVNKLDALNVLDDTFIFYTSDNGFHIGQFSQPWDKRQPYETDVRVPFFVRGPNVKRKVAVDRPVTAIDLAPTILDLASVNVPDDVDGTSFKDCLGDVDRCGLTSTSRVFTEYYGEGNAKTVDAECFPTPDGLSECVSDNWCKCEDARNNTYECVRILNDAEDFKFCRFDDDIGFMEAYDLKADPYELDNVIDGLDDEEKLYFNGVLNKFKLKT